MNLQTKADFTALMHKFLDPLKPYYSAGCARLHLGGWKLLISTVQMRSVTP